MTRLSVPVIDMRGARLPRVSPVRTAYFSVMQRLAAGPMRMFALSVTSAWPGHSATAAKPSRRRLGRCAPGRMPPW